ncbi:MAG: aminopeptidase N [Rhodobacteraceae bacterium]|nr:aminopeptidase N [Paracoccaceae bacterium]
MKISTPPTIKLSDYQPPAYTVATVALTFKLHPTATRVLSAIRFLPQSGGVLRLDGRGLKLISAAIDGQTLRTDQVLVDVEGLTVPEDLVPDRPFTWTAEVEIDPSANTGLEGLYMSNGIYCTQCEAQGFRKITYYPDRPDVMAVFTVTIEGDAPARLSNGNPTGPGTWHDPWPKPSYLFALVAGALVSVDDTFTTASGRKVNLQIWVHPGDEGKCGYAMDALKRSMRWDETEYGREYDLDLFMIVAVHDFNMGAMENKGLNIFNSKYVLASPETATDHDYALIEGIIAHEYFHNWTGNRITCRDWFQLCLKEGLTVFRDRQFSGDTRSRAVRRITDVLTLRTRQFREDAGPLAHPVRPEEYIEINNLYTATVYEKGAEVIGMLRTIVGPEKYRAALDLYFDRHDGQACTIEDWIRVFEDTCGTDLSRFALWYSQAGTPRVNVEAEHEGNTLRLHLRQILPDTPGQTGKSPQVIPLRAGFLAENGTEAAPEELLVLKEAHQTFVVEPVDAMPVLSINRGFSAPVIINHGQTGQDRAFLLTHDTDPFNKWEAGRVFALDLLQDMAVSGRAPDQGFADAMRDVALDDTLDPAFRALVLALPGEETIAQAVFASGNVPDPETIHRARRNLHRALALRMQDDLPGLYAAMAVPGIYSPAAQDAGKRALRGAALDLLTRVESGAETARAQFADAGNMTEQMGALTVLLSNAAGAEAARAFYDQWKADRLVIDKWFATQAATTPGNKAVEAVSSLTEHADFDWKNPNRFRSLIAGFAMMNPAGFHRADGAGYAFFTDWLLRLDPVNPQTTARLASAFETWRRYDNGRQALIRTQLERIAGTKGLSRDTGEIVGKMLAG